MTAMPGAVPTLWCDLHGVPRLEQRGIVQPFMLVIPVAAILLLLQAPDSDPLTGTPGHCSAGRRGWHLGRLEVVQAGRRSWLP
jgi:hypothetical protein